MKRFSQVVLAGLMWSGIATSQGVRAVDSAPSFREVYDLLKANLVNADDAKLDRAATEGLLRELGSQAMLLTNGQTSAAASGPLVSKALVYDGAFGYMRVARVEPGLAAELQSAIERLGAANKIKGWVLDLRFAGGLSYPSAAKAAEPFLTTDQPLLDWGQGVVRSTAKDSAIKVPVTVLVNRQTAGAAEALAAVLRKADVALLLGTNTAGRAFIMKDLPLHTGQQLRVATALVKTGDGEPLSAQGVKPDIQVAVSPADEKVYFEDSYRILTRPAYTGIRSGAEANLSASSTNKARHRINEAELVRMQREGEETDDEFAPGHAPELTKPVVRDPVLARALDLVKGLAIVRRAK